MNIRFSSAIPIPLEKQNKYTNLYLRLSKSTQQTGLQASYANAFQTAAEQKFHPQNVGQIRNVEIVPSDDFEYVFDGVKFPKIAARYPYMVVTDEQALDYEEIVKLRQEIDRVKHEYPHQNIQALVLKEKKLSSRFATRLLPYVWNLESPSFRTGKAM